jgi:AcrR family transcriptional regulator
MGMETFKKLDPGKQERVTRAALEEFADHGYHAASVNRMVARLGIAKGSLFKYFGSKEGIFRHVFNHAAALFGLTLKSVRNRTRGQPLDRRIRATLEASLEFVRSYPNVYRLYLKVLFQENFPCRDLLLREVRLSSARYLRPMLEEAARRGELRPGLDLDAAVFLLDAAMDRFLQAQAVPAMDPGLGLHRADSDHAARRLDQIGDLLRRALMTNHA